MMLGYVCSAGYLLPRCSKPGRSLSSVSAADCLWLSESILAFLARAKDVVGVAVRKVSVHLGFAEADSTRMPAG